MTANTWTIAAARDALRKGEITATDLTMSCLAAIDAADVTVISPVNGLFALSAAASLTLPKRSSTAPFEALAALNANLANTPRV